MKKKFIKGMGVGVLLAGVAWLLATPDGKKMKRQLEKEAQHIYKQVRLRYRQLEKPTRKKFDELVSIVAEEYGKKKGLARGVREKLLSYVETIKDHLYQEIGKEKD